MTQDAPEVPAAYSENKDPLDQLEQIFHPNLEMDRIIEADVDRILSDGLDHIDFNMQDILSGPPVDQIQSAALPGEFSQSMSFVS